MKIGIKHAHYKKPVFLWKELEKQINSVSNEYKSSYKEFYNFVNLLSHNEKFVTRLNKIRDKYLFNEFKLTEDLLNKIPKNRYIIIIDQIIMGAGKYLGLVNSNTRECSSAIASPVAPF